MNKHVESSKLNLRNLTMNYSLLKTTKYESGAILLFRVCYKQQTYIMEHKTFYLRKSCSVYVIL